MLRVMVIYIDPPKWPAHGTHFSHMVSDHSYQELHALALRIGVPPRAFDQDHYDVPKRLYDQAVMAGARPVEGGDLIRILRDSGLRVPSRERSERLLPLLRRRWDDRMPGQAPLGDMLLGMWDGRGRSYHNVTHLHECLSAADAILDASPRLGDILPIEVELAAWFHDAIYNGVAGRDEEDSAELARTEISGDLGSEVARLVLLTKDHRVPEGDAEGATLVDADLSILAAREGRYRRYTQQVRDEYAHVDEPDWIAGRTAVLQNLIGREHIYVTDHARSTWEPAARRNLEGELLGLSRNGPIPRTSPRSSALSAPE